MVDQLNLSEKSVLITGAAAGLGRGFAQAFDQAGAAVIISDINAQGLEETLETLGSGARAMTVDVTDSASCQALADFALNECGGIDVLVNNAALYAGLERKRFEDFDETVWDKVMAVNVKGVWQMCRSFSPQLRAKGAGSIINIASATVFSGSPQWMHYVASKGAVIAMTRVMAKEMGADNIRVNAIAPGFTLTDASLDLMSDAKNYGVDRAALKRNADIDDITGAALYLASDLARFTTGQTLIVDGGKQFI